LLPSIRAVVIRESLAGKTAYSIAPVTAIIVVGEVRVLPEVRASAPVILTDGALGIAGTRTRMEATAGVIVVRVVPAGNELVALATFLISRDAPIGKFPLFSSVIVAQPFVPARPAITI
jgi:hypothetical protein